MTRSGIKSTEFWVTAVTVILGVVTPTLVNLYGDESNLPEWAKAVSVLAGAGLSVLAGLGYTVARSSVKKAELEASTRTFEADTEASIAVLEHQTRQDPKNTREEGRVLLPLLLAIVLGMIGCSLFTTDGETDPQKVAAVIRAAARISTVEGLNQVKDVAARQKAARTIAGVVGAVQNVLDWDELTLGDIHLQMGTLVDLPPETKVSIMTAVDLLLLHIDTPVGTLLSEEQVLYVNSFLEGVRQGLVILDPSPARHSRR